MRHELHIELQMIKSHIPFDLLGEKKYSWRPLKEEKKSLSTSKILIFLVTYKHFSPIHTYAHTHTTACSLYLRVTS